MKEKNKKLYFLIYFLLGLFLNVVGLIAGLLWVKFKVRTNRKTKLYCLVGGFAVYLVFTLVVSPLVIQPFAERAIYSKFPDLKVVKESVEKAYPNGEVGVNYRWNKTLGTDKTTKTLTIVYDAKQLLTDKQVNDIAKLVCSTLQSRDTQYDYVVILSQTSLRSYIHVSIPFLNFYRNKSFGASCSEWMTTDVMTAQ